MREPFPRFKLLWDVETKPTTNWECIIPLRALHNVIHYLSSFCWLYHDRLNHCQVHLSASELQDAFEKIDFSQLAVTRKPYVIRNLYGLFRWLMHNVSLVNGHFIAYFYILHNRHPLFLLRLILLNHFLCGD